MDDQEYREYNDGTTHNMWVDYTTDMYEDTDYTGYGGDGVNGANSQPYDPTLLIDYKYVGQQIKAGRVRMERLQKKIATHRAKLEELENRLSGTTAQKQIKQLKGEIKREREIIKDMESRQAGLRAHVDGLDKLRSEHVRYVALYIFILLCFVLFFVILCR